MNCALVPVNRPGMWAQFIAPLHVIHSFKIDSLLRVSHNDIDQFTRYIDHFLYRVITDE